VQLKMALDAAGCVAAGDGAPVWVTGVEARAYAHLLRAEADAILVGSGTVLADDPELTCRLPGLGERSPDRIVLDARLRTPVTAKVFRENKVKTRIWVATTVEGYSTAESGAMRGNALVLDVGSHDGRSLDLDGLLDILADNGLTRLMVEGGPTVWQAFLAAGFVDEVCVVTGPKAADGPTISVIEGDYARHFARFGLKEAGSRMLGADRLRVYRRD
jgi:diaminohydroxyphosphoribosylaminopyrimidine deaminase / 5-amino-6-(5-phosphoribosylamino)uracil reductase